MAKIAEACCGVVPIDLVVDAPEEACISEDVTISGTYTVDPLWDPFEAYDTGVWLTVTEADGDTIYSGSITLATDESVAPKDFSFEYTFHIDLEGIYTYTVYAWSVTSWGTEETVIVGGTIETETCFEIDIKPSSDPNSINPKSKGVIPVAILGSDIFDVETVDPETVKFGSTGTEASPVRWTIEDVNIDSFFDVVFHFKTEDCGFSPGDETGTLTCNRGSASDSVNIVPKGKGPK